MKRSWVVEDPRLQAKKPRTQKNTQIHATYNPKKVYVCAVSALRKGLRHPQPRGPFPYLGTAKHHSRSHTLPHAANAEQGKEGGTALTAVRSHHLLAHVNPHSRREGTKTGLARAETPKQHNTRHFLWGVPKRPIGRMHQVLFFCNAVKSAFL